MTRYFQIIGCKRYGHDFPIGSLVKYNSFTTINGSAYELEGRLTHACEPDFQFVHPVDCVEIFDLNELNKEDNHV